MTEIASLFDPTLRKLIKRKTQVAVIPIGAIEQHGSHLPISTDSDIVTKIAKILSDKYGYLLLPTINYGVSFEHAPLFNLSIKRSTLRAILNDLCMSLVACNINTIFIINGHHGNLGAINNVDNSLKKHTNNKNHIHTLSYWHYIKREFDHAGFVETSLMLAISKNVKMTHAKKGLITEGMSSQEIKKLGRIAIKSFPTVTKNGVWGDPRKATSSDGRVILAEIIKNLGKKCQDCLCA